MARPKRSAPAVASGASMLNFDVDRIVALLAERNSQIKAKTEDMARELKNAAGEAIKASGLPILQLVKVYGLDHNCCARLIHGNDKVSLMSAMKVLVSLGYNVRFEVSRR